MHDYFVWLFSVVITFGLGAFVAYHFTSKALNSQLKALQDKHDILAVNHERLADRARMQFEQDQKTINLLKSTERKRVE